MSVKISDKYQLPQGLQGTYGALGPEDGRKIFSLAHSEGDFPIFGNDLKDECRIHLIGPEDVEELYYLLSGYASALEISILDNGSTGALQCFIRDNELNIRLLGAQSHCMISELANIPEEKITRLKDIRSRPDSSEIIWRTTELAVINLNVIRRGDQVGNLSAQTTGLTIEEACLNAKFIGASDLIKDIFIAGADYSSDPFEMIKSNVTNIRWYIEEGLNMRNIEPPIESEENLHFSLTPEGYKIDLLFVKSSQSGRWWVKVPMEDKGIYMACSKHDYDQACQNKLTARIMKAFGIA